MALVLYVEFQSFNQILSKITNNRQKPLWKDKVKGMRNAITFFLHHTEIQYRRSPPVFFYGPQQNIDCEVETTWCF